MIQREGGPSGFDFHTAVQMHHTFSVLVVAEGFERQSQQVRFFFEEHGGDLAFGSARSNEWSNG